MGGFISKSNLNEDNIIRPYNGLFCFNFLKDHRKIINHFYGNSGIYYFINHSNPSLSYIGSSINLGRRLEEHSFGVLNHIRDFLITLLLKFWLIKEVLIGLFEKLFLLFKKFVFMYIHKEFNFLF